MADKRKAAFPSKVGTMEKTASIICIKIPIKYGKVNMLRFIQFGWRSMDTFHLAWPNGLSDGGGLAND